MTFVANGAAGIRKDSTEPQVRDREIWLGFGPGGAAVRQGGDMIENVPSLPRPAPPDWIRALRGMPDAPVWYDWSGGRGVTCWMNGRVQEFKGAIGKGTDGEPVVLADSSGQVWFPRDEEGLGGEIGRFQAIIPQGGSRASLAPARDGGAWLASGDRLMRQHADGRVETVASLEAIGGGDAVNMLLEDASGTVWIATRGSGLIRWRDSEFHRVATSHNDVLSLTTDGEGNLWAGTHGGGLDQLRPRRFYLHKADEGLPSDNVISICEDKDGHLWLAPSFNPPVRSGDVPKREFGTQPGTESWSPPKAGIFDKHLDYAKWYATWWAARMTDAIDQYDPDFIYTDGTGKQPFEGFNTGTGIKADAMQSVIAHFYNQSLKRRGKVDTFSIVKFRPPTNGTVNTEEFGVPRDIITKQPWIAEIPVGDWFYAPGFFYDSGMMIRYIIEAVARDGNACICVSPQPDGSLDDGSLKMLKEVGIWMRANGQGIYGSKAWTIPGEGEIVKGQLKQLPGGKLGKQHAEFKFGPGDFRFTAGKDGALYAYCLTVPPSGSKLRISSLGSDKNMWNRKIQNVEVLGLRQSVKWKQDTDALLIEMPRGDFATAVGFRIR
ncbi:MAG: alpha-L-fucosidase [Luteolibacter sp.]